MAIDPKAIRRAMMVAKDIAASVSNVPLMKAKGGAIDQDLKIANLIGADTSSIPEIRKAGELNKFRQSMQEDVQSRAQRMANLGQKYHESGLLPHPVGTLLQSPDSRQKNLPPMKVMGHYVDSKNPDRYGYFVNQGDYNGIALVNDPAADERIRKNNPSWDRQEYWDQTQPLRGPQGFAKAKGGYVERLHRDAGGSDMPEDQDDDYLTVYHGTPHRFAPTERSELGEFDPAKIGTGEGAQVYGHGIYFAESPGVAKSYKDNLTSGLSVQKYDEEMPHAYAARLVKQWGSPEKAIAVLTDNGQEQPTGRRLEFLNAIKDQSYKNFADELPKGSLYTVKLPKKIIDQMLDWDKPLKEHPKEVRQALTKLAQNAAQSDEYLLREFEKLGPSAPANQLYAVLIQRAVRLKKYEGMRAGIPEDKAMPSLTYGQQIASEQLHQAGIPGIKYLDAGSRGQGGKGTRNFVVFPGAEHHLKIMKREKRGGLVTNNTQTSVIDPAKAIRRAKMVAKSIGGSNSESEQTEITPSHSETRTEAGKLQQPGAVRGGSGVLQASLQADPAAPLTDFPADIAIPATGQIIKAGPNPLIRQVASEYMRSMGRPYRPATAYAKVSPPRATRIAKAYEEMKHDPQDPLVKASYNQMLKETMAQYEAAKAAGFKAEFWNPETDEDPYGPSPRLAIEDVNKNHHMFVFPTRAGFGSDEEMAAELHQNPLLADSGERWNGQPVTYNDIFRAVHDYYGHAKEGVGFRADGEENAWRSHAAMYSPLARLAMTSETRGQNSWVNYGPHGEHNRKAKTEDTIFADQKNGILPAWVMHEGAEDFLHPDDVLETYKIYNRKHRADGGSLMDDDQPTTLKDPDLFDMSMLHETPKVAQFDLPRYMPARGVPERVADITKSRKVANKLADVIQSGLDMGGARWYNAEPLRKEFLKYHGQDVGNRMFRKYMDMVAATSPRSEVSQNVRNASYYYQRLASGQPVPEVGEKNPQPYGHLAQRLHQLNAQRVAGAGWDPLNNPKPASFAENLTGNQSPVTVDTHAFRLPSILAEDPRFIETAYKPSKEAPPQNIRKMVESGELSLKDALKTPAYWNAAPKETEYAAMEQMYKKAAQKLGITPAAAQAAAWVGGGKLTGLASDESKPFMQFVQDRIYKTAREKNMDPQDVLQKFVKGEMSLYSDGGAVDAALNIAKKARKE